MQSNAIKCKKRSDAEKFLLGKSTLCTVNLHACMLLDCESALVPVCVCFVCERERECE